MPLLSCLCCSYQLKTCIIQNLHSAPATPCVLPGEDLAQVQAGQGQVIPPHVREQLNGPVVLPSMFLRRLVPGLQVRHRAAPQCQYDLLQHDLIACLLMQDALHVEQ